jgi:hypothetical protein
MRSSDRVKLPPFPGGKRFAFTILDDTDVATVENVEPVYRLLMTLGIRATKTVWPVRCPEGSRNFSSSETLEDSHYLSFVRELADYGFEITWHGATMESSERPRIVAALERFKTEFGAYPRIHPNHALNRENIYWGTDRFDDQIVKRVVRRLIGIPDGYFQGHVEGSRYFWGDLCGRSIVYARNFTFNQANLRRINPSMPYRDPARPLVPWWFSATDAEDAAAFKTVLSPARQERLEREGGICILATHLGKGYATAGGVDPGSRRLLEELAHRPGWFPSVGELLDWLRGWRGEGALPAAERRRMEWRWLRDLVARKLSERLRPPRRLVNRSGSPYTRSQPFEPHRTVLTTHADRGRA